MHYTMWKEPDSKIYMLCEFTYMMFWKRQN